MKIKSMYPPALVHLTSGWYIVAGEILEVDGRPAAGPYHPVPAETRLEDLEFVRGTPSGQEAPLVAGRRVYPTDPDFYLEEMETVRSSDGRSTYTLERWRNQVSRGWFWTCTCKGFKYRGMCKHIVQVDSERI